jgi:hypothetical protein
LDVGDTATGCPVLGGVRSEGGGEGGSSGAASLDKGGSVVPVILVFAGVLAIVDGGNLEDTVSRGGALAVAAERRASPLVPVASLLGLLRLWERFRGDGAQRQEGQGHGTARVRHVG